MPQTFEFDRLVEYTDSAILAELRRVADIARNEPFTTRRFQRDSRVSFSTVKKRFGSWRNALIEAGLGDRWTGSRAEKLSLASGLTDQQICNELVALSAHIGKSVLTSRDIKAHLPVGVDVLKTRWGSARAAFEAAGISLSASGRRYSETECFDNLFTVWTHYGRPPRIREMSAPPSVVGSGAYLTRFGSWRNALTAFAGRVDSDLAISVGACEQETSTSVGSLDSVVADNKKRDKRGIPLGLRFSVLSRDRFRCVLCGDAPSTNTKCVLHIDHVIPWSKGGRTSVENLRSLCSECNTGRGNRYND